MPNKSAAAKSTTVSNRLLPVFRAADGELEQIFLCKEKEQDDGYHVERPNGRQKAPVVVTDRTHVLTKGPRLVF